MAGKKRTRARAAVPLSVPYPRTRINLPIETIEHILSYLTPHRGDCDDWRNNHASLCSVALVSKTWGGAAQRELYGTLHVRWRAGNAPKLLRTFAESPHLLATVREVAVMFVTQDDWADTWQMSEESEVVWDEADELYPSDVDEDASDSGYVSAEHYIRNDEHAAHTDSAEWNAMKASVDWPWLSVESGGRQEGADALWSLIAKNFASFSWTAWTSRWTPICLIESRPSSRSCTTLHIGFWPTTAQLATLPRTLEVLHLNLGLVGPTPPVELLNAVPSWKERFLPELKSLVIKPTMAWKQAGGTTWSEEEQGAVKRDTTDFVVRFLKVQDREIDLPGPWWSS